MKVLVSKTFIDLDISHNEFVLVDNVLKEYNNTKEAFKNPDNRYMRLIQ